MRIFITPEIITTITGWSFVDIYNIESIIALIEATGATDLLCTPKDYPRYAYAFKDMQSIQGRTKEDKPYFMVFGIKFIMLSLEDAAKYQVLK